MSEWTDERHAEACEWCKGGGSKSRDFAAALDEIERLQALLRKHGRHARGCYQYDAPDESRGCNCGWVYEKVNLDRD